MDAKAYFERVALRELADLRSDGRFVHKDGTPYAES
jgi:hypothetical protein